MPSFSDFAEFEGFLFAARVSRALCPTAAALGRPAPHLQTPRWSLNQNKTRSLILLSEQIERSAMKNIALSLAAIGLITVPSFGRAQFASSVISYEHGTGYSANFTNAAAALGAPASGSGITPFAPPFSASQIVSVGTDG